MTITIGYHCYKGVIVAADSLVTIGTQMLEGKKLDIFWANGSFASVYASEDSNATMTLINEIKYALLNSPTSSYQDLEILLKRYMKNWWDSFGLQKPPASQIIMGVILPGRERAKLYFCEPPSTVIEKDNYVGVGIGADVTDTLCETIFGAYGGEYEDVQVVLRWIAYLLYKAKKETTQCGKTTHAAVVFKSNEEPEEVSVISMERAERLSSEIDVLLSQAAIFALAENKKSLAERAKELAEFFKLLSVGSTEFDNNYGDLLETTQIKP